MQTTRRPAPGTALRWVAAAGVFAAGALAGWLAARGRPGALTHEASEEGHVAASRDVGVTGRAADVARARRPADSPDSGERPAFPDLRWREASSAPPPPPDPGATAEAPPTSSQPTPPMSVAKALALLGEMSRDPKPPDESQRGAAMQAAGLLANATPLPEVPMDVFRALAVRFPDEDVGGVLLPCVAADDVARELATLLGGGGDWGADRQRDVWIVRFADVVAEHGELPAGTVERLLTWPRPWVRATAIGPALERGVIDRSRLREIVERDPDPDVRVTAFRWFVETAREGDESDTLDVVRRVLQSDGPEGDVAIEALPGLGPAAVPLAREVVAAGGLTGGEVRDVAETLLRGGSPDDLVVLAATGRFNDELLDAIDDLVTEEPERLASVTPLVRALPAPRSASDAEDHFQRIANLGLRQIVVESACSAAADPVVRVAAFHTLWDDEERRAETAGLVAAALRDPNADVRRLLVDELGEDLASTSPEHLAVLRAISASDPSAAVRRAATEALPRAE